MALRLSEETTDLRSGPEIHQALLALLPLVGRWYGAGTGIRLQDGAPFRYRQLMTFAHDGRPFLSFQSRTWPVGADDQTDGDAVAMPASAEAGFWRPGAGPDDIELVTVLADGIAQSMVGIAATTRWELRSTAVALAPSAVPIAGERRLYAIVADGDAGEALAYVAELAVVPDDFRPHLNATLKRV